MARRLDEDHIQTSSERALVPPSFAPFEADVNLSRVRELSADETRRIIANAEKGAMLDVVRDVLHRTDTVLAGDGTTVDVIEERSKVRLAAARAQMRIEDGTTSEQNQRIINDFWDEIQPHVRGSIELPIDRAVEAIRLLPAPTGEPTRFFPAMGAPEKGAGSRFSFSPGRELIVTERIENSTEGTTYLRIINPLNIVEEVFVEVGPNGAWAETLPRTEHYVENDENQVATDLPSFTLGQELALGFQAARFQNAGHGRDIVNRTVEHRLVDHERLLHDLRDPGENAGLTALADALDMGPSSPMMIIDIGPGIANLDRSTVNDCAGKPAITSQELAEDFPDAQVIILDLPEQVRTFFGLDPITGPVLETRRGNGHVERIDRTADARLQLARERAALLRHANIHIVAGNGLESLRAQIENPVRNHLNRPDANLSNMVRDIPRLTPETTVVIRAANSIDVYCHWDTPNGLSPSLRDALRTMAKDYRDSPVLLLFNRAIIVKRRYETEWRIVGRVSDAGFNSTDRNVTHSGRPSYELDASRIAERGDDVPTLEFIQ